MREIYIFKRMEVLKIKTKSDSKGTKDKIIELFFIKRLKPVDIAKKLKKMKGILRRKNRENRKIKKRIRFKNEYTHKTEEKKKNKIR